MNLTDLREQTGAVLAKLPEIESGAWALHPAGPPDLVDPPAVVLVWPEIMATVGSMCTDTAELIVVCVAARYPAADANYPTLEAMLDTGRDALGAAGLRPYQMLGPAPFVMGQVTYLAARMFIRQPVNAGG